MLAHRAGPATHKVTPQGPQFCPLSWGLFANPLDVRQHRPLARGHRSEWRATGSPSQDASDCAGRAGGYWRRCELGRDSGAKSEFRGVLICPVVNFEHRGPVVRANIGPSPHSSVAVIGDENAITRSGLLQEPAPMQRRRIRQTVPLEERLIQEAARLRQLARGTPPGIERERMIRRARQAESASHLSE